MAIVNNTLSEINDTIIVPAGVPITGLSAISGYSESVSGVTGTRYFEREFRYSLDGINWTTYIALTAPNLVAIPIDPTYDFFIEYKYTRAGTDPTGLLVFDYVNLDGTYLAVDCGITFNQSVFSYFFDSCVEEDIMNWCVNVLDKIYKPGIVSLSLTRGENQNANQEDRDYIDFWRSISCYFSLMVNYARQFENIPTHRDLLTSYLRGRGFIVCENTSLADLNYIMENYWDEMRQRGTVMVSKKKGEIVNSVAKPVDGELLRLICYNNACDEFLFGISEFNRIGWVVNEWSPLYQGLTDQTQFTKLFEHSKSVLDLSRYPLLNAPDVSIVDDTVPDSIIVVPTGTMEIDTPTAGQTAGIGFTTPDFAFSTNVSPEIAYELSFYVKAISGTPKISVKLHGYDINDSVADIREVKTSALMPVSNDIMIEEGLPTTGDWYSIVCTIHPSTHVYDADPRVTTPTIGAGNNLKLTDNVCKVIPEILVDNTNSLSSGNVRLWNVRFAPSKTDYSTGFLNTANFIQTWMSLNGGSNTQEEVTEIMKYYLLPYKVFINNNFL